MSLSEERLQLMRPAIPYMWFIERKFIDVEDGLATLEQVLPWVLEANARIEALVVSEDLRLLQFSNADDRYRMKQFLNG